MYINVEESGTKWCEVVDEILFGGRSDLSDFSSTERQVFVLCSWENTPFLRMAHGNGTKGEMQ